MAFAEMRGGYRPRGGGKGMRCYENSNPTYKRSDGNMFSCLVGDDGHDGDTDHSTSSDSEDILGDKFSSSYQEVRYKKKRKLNSSSADKLESHEFPESDEEAIDFESLSKDQKLNLILSKLSVNEKRLKHNEQMLKGAVQQTARVQKVEKVVKSYQDRIKLLEYKTIDMEARRRRCNLLFYRLYENRRENCSDLIIQFLADNFAINIECNAIARAHRVGRYKGPNRPRPIIVAFQEYRMTERIMEQAHKLRNTQFGVSRDYPAEITTSRKTLWPEFKRMKSLNSSAKVAIVYPAKLVIDGNVVNDLFPEWDLIMRGSRIDLRHPSQQSALAARMQQQPETVMQGGINNVAQSTPMHNPPNETVMKSEQ